MAAFSEILEYYLNAVQHMSGARCVSLYVPDPIGNNSRSILIHTEESPRIPELASLESAQQASRAISHAPTLAENSHELGDLIPSQAPNGFLLPLYSKAGANHETPTAWIGLGGLPNPPAIKESIKQDPIHWWNWLKGLGGAITRDSLRILGVLNDPVTGLPGRAELFQQLKKQLEDTDVQSSTSIVFLSPDNFSTINELRGLQAGDAIIREVAECLKPLMRPSDLFVRYGGVVFAVLLARTSQVEGKALAQQFHEKISNSTFLDGNVHLYFSGGVACADFTDQTDALTLIQRGHQALNSAKRAGGSQVAQWQTTHATAQGDDTEDQLTGIFTGTMGKDYRNMILLWDMVGFMADSGGPHQFASKVVESIYNAFRPGRIGFFVAQTVDEADTPDENEPAEVPELRLVEGYVPIKQSGFSKMVHTQSREAFVLTDDEQLLLEQACSQGVTLGSNIAHVKTTDLNLPDSSIVLPLLTRNRCVGCFYLSRKDGTIQLDSADIHFLKVFANQIAVALDRTLLAQQEKRLLERKRLKLLGEVHELRQALSHAKLVHCSTAMESILSMARQVAPTDATVLVTGESGTGKGVLADTIHKLSSRKNKPLIMVDCSAISTNLIESELFGHEKGAFTGAEKKNLGRLSEADGGTVFLDEIGELPLEIQSKLLTFVQDKAIVPVGSSKSRQVDVRIVAATNRDLAIEVDAGRFRRDLYYRLNVVTIQLPALRDRPDDILLLARHFLERSNVQYQKSVHGFTAEAEAALRIHPWPGNVRELQNRIMRAVILCGGDMLGPLELGFAQAHQSAIPAASTVTTAMPPVMAPAPVEAPVSLSDPWEQLDQTLELIIQRVDGHRDNQPPPFGKWLEDDLVETAYRQVGGIHRRGASLLGIPETTFRRRMKQIQARSHIGPTPRTPEWVEVTDVLDRITNNENPAQEDWVLRSREILLQHVLNRFGNRVPLASSLMGVTEPTIHRWRSKMVVETAASHV